MKFTIHFNEDEISRILTKHVASLQKTGQAPTGVVASWAWNTCTERLEINVTVEGK